MRSQMKSLSASPRRCCSIFSVLLAFAMASGCKPSPQVTTYSAPHEAEDTQVPDEPEDPKSGDRILGLIAPAAGGDSPQWWFFKLRGRPKAVGARAKLLETFAGTLKFPPSGQGIPEFRLPDGWTTLQSRSDFSVLSIRTGHPYTPHKIDVSTAGGELTDNLNRWRGQVGLQKLSEDEVKKSLKELKDADGKTVYFVDITGPGGGGDQMMVPPFAK